MAAQFLQRFISAKLQAGEDTAIGWVNFLHILQYNGIPSTSHGLFAHHLGALRRASVALWAK